MQYSLQIISNSSHFDSLSPPFGSSARNRATAHMRVSSSHSRPGRPRTRAALPLALLFAACCVLLAGAVSAPAKNLQSKLNHDRSKLGKVQSRQGNVADQIASYNKQIDTLLGEVSALAAKRDAVQQQLDAKQASLDRATAALARERHHLQVVRGQLKRALAVLRKRLVAMYEAGSPDSVSVVLEPGTGLTSSARTAYMRADPELRHPDRHPRADAPQRDQARRRAERKARAQIKDARDALASQEQEPGETPRPRCRPSTTSSPRRRPRARTCSTRCRGRRRILQQSITSAEAKLAPPPTVSLRRQRDRSAAGAAPVPGDTATLLPNGQAAPPANAPPAVIAAIQAANSIATTPYIWGGGHGSFPCPPATTAPARSASCSTAAASSTSPLDSTGLEFWGESGTGSWITVYANSGHAFAIVAGLRWDTVGDISGTGPRWHSDIAARTSAPSSPVTRSATEHLSGGGSARVGAAPMITSRSFI